MASKLEMREPERDARVWRRDLDATLRWERWERRLLAVLASIPILITISIVITLAYESLLFFAEVPLADFLFDTQWTPTMAGDNATFGIGVLLSATVLVTAIATAVAVPVGLLGAIYLAEYANPTVRRFLKPTLEALSGVPTVIFGYFALLTLTPLLRATLFPEIAGFNALSAGIAVGILVVPTISSLSEEALRRVPDELRAGGAALGMTPSETTARVVLPAALPGIAAAIALALSLALGETTIAAIAAGQRPVLTFDPFVPVETMTAFILQVSLGTVEFGSIAFATVFTVGTVLFAIALVLNTVANWLMRREPVRAGTALAAAERPSATAAASSGQVATLPGASVARSAPSPSVQVELLPPSPRRLQLERGVQFLALVAAFAGIVVLLVLLLDLAGEGLPRLQPEFFASFPSRRAEESGIYPALVGTLWMLGLVTLTIVPVGVGAAVFLEEYFPDNWLGRAIEINIANLAAVPSIIYGLLGLELFVRVLRPVTGGYSILAAALTLAAIALPLAIIASRSALAAVPEALRQGGYAAGMTRGQVLRAIVIPAALPGMAAGVLQALSRALGETAALVAVGALASIRFVPELSLAGLQERYTVLPVQVFFWLQEADPAVRANAAAATIVLVALVLALNVAAVLLRDVYDRRRVA